MNATLLLGTNLGNRLLNLQKAIENLSEISEKKISESGIYETEAWGFNDQPNYYNMVVQVGVKLSPRELLDFILDTEKRMGRIRDRKWGSRIIDIDILYMEGLCLQEPGLEIPHPHISERRFVLTPLADLLPDMVHPVLQKSNRTLLTECIDPLRVTLLK